MFRKFMIAFVLSIILTSCTSQPMKDDPNSEAYTLYNNIFITNIRINFTFSQKFLGV